MALLHITRESVLSAIALHDQMGMQAFLDHFGFKEPTKFWLRYEGKFYASKAIANVAQSIGMGQQYNRSMMISGGGALVKRLRLLGFDVGEQLALAPDTEESVVPVRNPDWTRDELILALDLYQRNPASPPGKASSEVEVLSQLLRQLGRLNSVQYNEKYRNANGVYMKMMNFRALDARFTSAGKAGMKRGAKGDQAVWDEFLGREPELRSAAALIRDSLCNPEIFRRMAQVEDVDDGAEEGGVLHRRHRVYERDRSLIKRKKAEGMQKHGKLVCEACGFDFAAVYGEMGRDYIEVHHTRPVSQMLPGEKTKLEDLALLCSNCHRMAHRRKTVISVEEIRKIIAG